MQSYQTLEDSALVRLAREEHAAYEELYRRHVTAIYRYCYARVETVSDAEDLTAQTFLAALESLSRYRQRGTFKAWLFRIARNKCSDFYRGVYAAPPAVADPDTAAETVADTDADGPEAMLLLREVLACVERMLPSLSADRMEALRLRYWGDLSMRDVAKVMQRTEAAVKMLVSRAISDLRERCVRE